MPELAWCVCQVVAGIHGNDAIVVVEFHGTVAVYDGLALPVCVSYRPSMCGLSQVCESGSFTLCGKSQVLSDFAEAEPSQLAGTPFDAPSVNSTMIRSPDCVPAGTVRNWSHPR